MGFCGLFQGDLIVYRQRNILYIEEKHTGQQDFGMVKGRGHAVVWYWMFAREMVMTERIPLKLFKVLLPPYFYPPSPFIQKPGLVPVGI